MKLHKEISTVKLDVFKRQGGPLLDKVNDVGGVEKLLETVETEVKTLNRGKFTTF